MKEIKELNEEELNHVNGGWVVLAIRGIAAVGTLFGAGYTLGTAIARR